MHYNLKVLIWPHPKLKMVSEPVMEPLFVDLVSEMYDLMHRSGGIGLSAIQVGLPMAFFVSEINNIAKTCVNPVICTFLGEPTPMLEGCLSLPGQVEAVKRFPSIEVEYATPDLKETIREVLVGQAAHVFQHEYEHLQGKLFVDKLPAAKRSLIRGNLQKKKINRSF